MKLSHLFLAALALPLAACASGKDERDASAEGPPVAGQAAPTEQPGRLARIFGADANEANAGPCPLLGVLYDASRLVEFKGGEERFANVAYTGEMRGVRGLCRYTGSNPIEMSLDIDLAFGKGPAAEEDSRTYRYWVAVTRANMAPIEKQYFDITVNFPRGEDRMAGTDTVRRIVIPRANDTVSGANFEILVGFELTPEQIAFNRAGKRFRVDVGQEPSGQQKK
ncbi:MAG: hypothetical protein IV086_15745 [Hyphomonadaceae bacterium]|nr:MAG: hypothetical protein FD160_405 [Caulobacteraceae bacterium]MBT9447155.1 hypothetical protein [Hyphomonadaceae bacterium]TPW03185.1 MAG: hypothetical protein FD124_3111 [Alphaproteobacteria bacterium]